MWWQRFSARVHAISTGGVTLVALVVFILFVLIVLPDQAGSADANSNNAGAPDLSLTYSADDLYRWAEAYGEDGRRGYIRARFTFDLVWPLVYTAFLLTAISWLSRKAFDAGSPWQRANLVPLLAAVFDFLENGSTSLVMWRYPSQTAVVDTLAGLFTLVKWSLVGGSFALLLVSTVSVGVVWSRSRRAK